MELDFEIDKITESIEEVRTEKYFMNKSKKIFAELDDVGFIGIPNHTLTTDDKAFFAKKAMEARVRYKAVHTKGNTDSRATTKRRTP